MKKESNYREKLIQRQLTKIPDGKNSAAMQAWRSFAAHLMSITGEGGFLVLYSRSLHLLNAAFPMLPNEPLPPSPESWLADLEFSLAGQDLTKANAVNHQLLMTFTNILASLIGEELTIEILHSAWGETVTNRDAESKEIKDEK